MRLSQKIDLHQLRLEEEIEEILWVEKLDRMLDLDNMILLQDLQDLNIPLEKRETTI